MPNPFIDIGQGRRYHFLAPDQAVLDIESIAATLANNCRFNGRLGWISVAEHCVNCSRIVPPRFAFDALMHDAHESVVQDIVTPMKPLLPQYAALEAMAQYAISRRYGTAFSLPEAVKTADAILLKAEAEYLGTDTSSWGLPADLPKIKVKIEGLSPRRAKAAFLASYRELTAPKWKKA